MWPSLHPRSRRLQPPELDPGRCQRLEPAPTRLIRCFPAGSFLDRPTRGDLRRMCWSSVGTKQAPSSRGARLAAIPCRSISLQEERRIVSLASLASGEKRVIGSSGRALWSALCPSTALGLYPSLRSHRDGVSGGRTVLSAVEYRPTAGAGGLSPNTGHFLPGRWTIPQTMPGNP